MCRYIRKPVDKNSTKTDGRRWIIKTMGNKYKHQIHICMCVYVRMHVCTYVCICLFNTYTAYMASPWHCHCYKCNFNLPQLHSHTFANAILQEDGERSQSMKRPRPTLRPHTAPDVVKARETASTSWRDRKPADLGDMLLEDFSTGKSSASKVGRQTKSSFKNCFFCLGFGNAVASIALVPNLQPLVPRIPTVRQAYI